MKQFMEAHTQHRVFLGQALPQQHRVVDSVCLCEYLQIGGGQEELWTE